MFTHIFKTLANNRLSTLKDVGKCYKSGRDRLQYLQQTAKLPLSTSGGAVAHCSGSIVASEKGFAPSNRKFVK